MPSKKIKRARKPTHVDQAITYINLTQKTENKAQQVTAPKKNGGRSANRNIVQLINFGGYRQFSVPKPPLLLAAKRYGQV
jgi:hypothetical protein